ncbi:efflux transporter outer membrane subunit [Pseudomonas sp. Gutcm_11s]|uniref:efflux transporter outer membrane subunit n=1 Tax=Pseudomonas sp. Gutcm_11s TaxID=3026088 RepID=UPI00235F828B|nr:efflux transporter outer membrane subunit [Pseudomonas sp. Gutcm_11s]MDD0842859.1 efflux transporter outer membrane subunit [Pseudomonas sp. Gutcm_11s]
MLRISWSRLVRASLLTLIFPLAGCIDGQGIFPHTELLHADRLDPGAAVRQAEREAAWPHAHWWRAYGDAQLDEWMEQALANSPSLAQAAARVRRASAMAGVVESAEAPQVGLDASVQRKRWPADYFYGPGVLGRSSSWNNSSQLGFRYDLDLWGRERSRSHAAVDRVRQQVAEARVAALELQGNLLRSYIQLALLYAETDIAQALLTQQQARVQLAESRLRDGIGTRQEVNRLQEPLAESHRHLDALHEARVITQHQLAALAGQGPGAGERLRRPKLNLQRSIGLPTQLPLQLLGQRPDLQARRWQVTAAARGIEVAKADFYPNVDLLAGLGSNATQGGLLDFLHYDKLAYNVGPALNLPLYDGGRRRGQLGVASADYDLAVEQYNQSLLQALQQVADGLVRQQSLQQQAQLATDAVAVAQRSCDLAALAQQRGLTGYDEVLQARPALLERQLTQQRVLAARLSAQADLLLALGGGLQPPEADANDASLMPHEPRLRLLSRP